MKCRVISVVLGAMMIPVLILPAPSSGAEVAVGWQDATLADDCELYAAYKPQTAIDGEGNVMAVWLQGDGSSYKVHACLHTSDFGWQETELIQEGGAQAKDLSVAMSAGGDAVVAWSQMDGTTWEWDVWGNVYVDGVGWTGAEMLSFADLTDDEYPDSAIDSGGNAVVAWSQQGVPANISMVRYNAGTGWSAPVSIDETAVADAYYPSIGIDEDDNMLFTWVQYEMSAPSIWSKRHDAVDGWSASVKVADTGMYGEPELSMGASGDAVCAWEHDNDTTSKVEVWSCMYDESTGWGAPALSGHSSSGDHEDPKVAIDSDGNAAVVWWSHGSFDDGVHYRPYMIGVGWGESVQMAYSLMGQTSEPYIAMNADGDALCVFLHYDDMYKLRGTVRGPEGAWAPSVLLSEDSLGSVSNSALSIDEYGNGLAVWDQYDGVRTNVWSAEYLVPDDTPPSVVIDSPEDGSTVDSYVVTVTGITEPGVDLTVNGLAVGVEGDGSFSCALLLEEGENTITATATDASGNSASDSVVVDYQPSVPSEDDIAEIIDRLNETVSELVLVRFELNETNAELDETTGLLDDAVGALEDAQGEIDDANSRIDSLSTQMALLAIVLGVLAVVALVMTAMYFNLRRRVSGGGSDSDEQKTPPPPE